MIVYGAQSLAYKFISVLLGKVMTQTCSAVNAITYTWRIRTFRAEARKRLKCQ